MKECHHKKAMEHMKKAAHHHEKAKHHMEKAKKMEPKEIHIMKIEKRVGGKK